MRFRSLALALASLPLVVACSAVADKIGSSDSDHTEDQPTYAQYKWLWSDETEDEFKSIAKAGSTWSEPEFLPIDHPMAQRLQFWVDKMDEALRARNPKALASTPKPRIILRKDSDPNAWVSYIPVTWKVKGQLARAKSAPAPSPAPGDAGDGGLAEAGTPAAPPTIPTLMLFSTGKVGRPGELPPLERRFDDQSLSELVKFANDGFAKCRLSNAEGAIVFGDGCAVDSQVSADRSDAIAFYATGKWVTVTTGLITSMLDEERIVAVLAHELGHYYRSHSMQPSDQLNYFYALGDANKPEKPGADPRYVEQTAKVREKLRSNDWFVDYSEENKLMTEQRLGFYTTEQEADEISLEILARMGLPPTLGPDSQALLHKIVDDLVQASGGGGDSGDVKWEKCAALRERGFKDEAGQIVSVPVGNLSDPHHSFCFRVFNMQRELEAHKYQLAGERPRPPGEAWSKVLQRLQNDIDPPPPPPPPPPPVSDAGAGDAGRD